MKMVDLHRQYLGIRDEVDRAIGDVIAETAFIKGPAVGLFEEELARRLGVHAGADVRLAFTKIGNGFWAVRLK